MDMTAEQEKSLIGYTQELIDTFDINAVGEAIVAFYTDIHGNRAEVSVHITTDLNEWIGSGKDPA